MWWLYAPSFQFSILSRYVSTIGFNQVNIFLLFSDCKCNPHGSRTLECGKDNGVCSCKEGFAGIKCDECLPNVIGDNCDTCQGNLPNYPYCKEG